MRVKIFQAFGYKQIEALEEKINAWIEGAEVNGWKVKQTQTALAGVGGGDGEDGLTQVVVITIWYDL